MALQLHKEKLCCSICLDLPKDPATIPCGHSYCVSCIKSHWDKEDPDEIYSCPHCKQTFTPRPVLVKSAMFADFVEHKLIFCRSDQQTICILCSMDAHKDHDLVSTSAERNKKQMELGVSREKIQMRIQQKEKDVKVLQQEVETINHSADKAVKDSEKVFTELVCFIEKRSSALREQIRSKQEAEVSRFRKLEEKLKQEIAELRVKDAELEQLSHTDDHIQFLHKYLVLYHLSESTDSPFLNIQPLTYFDDVTVAASQTRDRLQDILSEDWLKISQKVIEVDVLLPHPKPETREEFLQYSRQITLDPNTINTQLSLSAGNRKATVMREKQLYSSHPDRFTDWLQVLSRQSLTGRCYWEVQRSSGGVSVAVTYEDISRTGNESGFGNNDKSWALGCFDQSYYFRHNNMRTVLSGPQSSKIGVFLDHKAGTLSFYSISDTMTLLHKVCTTFTQPLYAGFLIYWAGDSATLEEQPLSGGGEDITNW
uniref:E3 ubiquitin/ISG15 ligase TRIM25-like n=1 Tax=Acanthochromis polyacanthus TaxID=80966 RepID=A0A3Q1GUR4_9TELE